MPRRPRIPTSFDGSEYVTQAERDILRPASNGVFFNRSCKPTHIPKIARSMDEPPLVQQRPADPMTPHDAHAPALYDPCGLDQSETNGDRREIISRDCSASRIHILFRPLVIGFIA